MKRFIRINDENIVISVRFGTKQIDGEILSDYGEVGQKRLEDGAFVDAPQPEVEQQPSLEDKVNFLYYREMGLI